MRARLRLAALVLGLAVGVAAGGFVPEAAAELVPGGWLQPPSHTPEPEIPPPAIRSPALPPAAVSAPRKPPHRPAQPPRMRAPSQPPSDGQVRF
jgi:hypothetical protein